MEWVFIVAANGALHPGWTQGSAASEGVLQAEISTGNSSENNLVEAITGDNLDTTVSIIERNPVHPGQSGAPLSPEVDMVHGEGVPQALKQSHSGYLDVGCEKHSRNAECYAMCCRDPNSPYE